MKTLLSYVIILAIAVSLSFHLHHLWRVQQIRRAAGLVHGAIVEIESGQRGYLLTGNERYLKRADLYRKLLAKRMESLCVVIPHNPENAALCRRMNALIAAKLEEMQSTINLMRAGKVPQAVQKVRTDLGFEYMEQIQRGLDQIRIEEDRAAQSMPGACLLIQ